MPGFFDGLPDDVILSWVDFSDRCYFVIQFKCDAVSYSYRICLFYPFKPDLSPHATSIFFSVCSQHVVKRSSGTRDNTFHYFNKVLQYRMIFSVAPRFSTTYSLVTSHASRK